MILSTPYGLQLFKCTESYINVQQLHSVAPVCYNLLFTAHCPFQNRMNRSDVYTEVSSLLLKGTFLFIMWQSFRTRNISNLLIKNKLSVSVYGKDCNTC
jgi:hypothetical protein